MLVNIISRADAEATIREQIISTIFQDAPKQSTFVSLAWKLPNMTSNRTRMRVLDLPLAAYWVDGDTGMKQTTRQAWDNVFIEAAELAVTVSIPEAVLDDAEFDTFGEIIPRVNEAIGQRVDSAIIFGVNHPCNWQNDIITLARQAGNSMAVGSSPDYYSLLLGESGVISKVEEDGYMATGALTAMTMRVKLRGIRPTDGSPVFKSDIQGSINCALDGASMCFPQNGAYDSTIVQLIVGDFKQAVYSIYQGVTVEILDQGVVQDPVTKEIGYNLVQQDMVTLRIVFRMGWALSNPVIQIDEDRLGCPFTYSEPTSPVTTQKVTFTVKDNAETPAAIDGAIVDVNGSRIKTDVSGVAEFNLRVGTYPAKVKKSGYGQITETVTVVAEAVTKDVTLIKQ